MAWIHLVALLALIQYLLFGALVGRARGKYGVHAPATTGNEVFERYYRVQMNTLELMVVLLPAMWMAAAYWDTRWVAAAGAVYLAGRVIYLRAYTRDPGRPGAGLHAERRADLGADRGGRHWGGAARPERRDALTPLAQASTRRIQAPISSTSSWHTECGIMYSCHSTG